MFRQLPEAAGATVTVTINGRPFKVPADCTAATAVLLANELPGRTTPVSGEPRAPYCMMGVCFECLMKIDGMSNQQGCLVPVAEGMRIDRQDGKADARA